MKSTSSQLRFEFDSEVLRAESFLKWVGGKGQLLSQLEPLFPPVFQRYYEPFLGGGAVFFHLQPPDALLSDSNPNLIATYRHVQTQLDALLEILHTLRKHYHSLVPEQQEVEYYNFRTRYNLLQTDSLEKSALLIFLNKTGYNGLYRESRKSGFNVPFGRYDNPAIFDEVNLKAVSLALKKVELRHSDFSQAVEMATAGDFVYFDPPYVPLSKTSSFVSYTKDEFGPEKQKELAAMAHELANRGVLVMLSNSESDFIRELYQDFQQHEVQAGRAVNSKPELRGKITELVMTSYRV